MVEEIKIKNFLSFRDEQVFSFVATKERKENSLWITEVNGTKLLKALFLFGENASGKTNLLYSFRILYSLICIKKTSLEDKLGVVPFLMDNNTIKEDSIFTIIYHLENAKYQYRIVLNDERIKEEELRKIVGKSNSRIYNRIFNEDTQISDVIFGTVANLSRADQRAVAQNITNNNTVIAVFANMNIESTELNKTYQYFSKKTFFSLGMHTDIDSLVAEEMERSPKLSEYLIRLLKTIGSNISGLNIKEYSIDIPTGMEEFIKRNVSAGDIKDGKLQRKELTFTHHTSSGDWNIERDLQSEGTLNFIKIAVLLYNIIKTGKFAAIDEIERGIHTNILNILLENYLLLSTNSQIVFSTHATSLLSYDKMRRDCIRLVIKASDGASNVKGLDLKSIHKNQSLYNLYLKGYLEGVPNVLKSEFDESERDSWYDLVYVD